MTDNTPLPWIMSLPYPVRNMLRRWRGMIGMIVGVGIALGLGMTMLAVSKASNDIFTEDYRASNADLYAVTEGGTLIAFLPGDTVGTIEHARSVLAQIRGINEVSEAVGILSWPLERSQGRARKSDEPAELIAAMGIDGDPTRVPEMLLLQKGRWIRRTNEVVLGAKLSREKGISVGDAVRLNNRDFTVVGIGRLRGVGFTSDSLAYMDSRALRQRVDVGDVVNFIVIDTLAPELIQQRIRQIGSLSVYLPSELIKQAEAVNASSVAIRMIFNVLTLSIAGLFVSNMLGRSVAERRLEFATLRAIGIPQRTIFFTVGAEALLVSIAAGGFGVILSLGFGALINGILAPEFGFESLYSLDAGLFAVVIFLALSLGLFAGLFPARQATRVDPVEILREA